MFWDDREHTQVGQELPRLTGFIGIDSTFPMKDLNFSR